MSEHDIGELADGDENRCPYTVHANGDWEDYRCELVVEHPGPHAIGLRHHAWPLINDMQARLGGIETALKLVDEHLGAAQFSLDLAIMAVQDDPQ